MRTFSKQLVLLALGLMLSSAIASQANATVNPNCPTVSSNGPLGANKAYGFYAFGADSSGGTNATVTMVGDVETDSSGCPARIYFGFNDNGTACTGTFSSVITPNTAVGAPPKTGNMTWTPLTGCILPANVISFHYANAPTSNVMYISNDGGGSGLGTDLVVGGTIRLNGGSDVNGTLPGGTGGPSTIITKHH
jgi:hypothetical protein